jgi:hypothetical protein
MMTAESAAEIARQFVASQDLRGFRYTFVGVRPSERHSGRWHATFDVQTADGAVIEGPAVVVVEEADQSARFLT